MEGFENMTHSDYFSRKYASNPSSLDTGVGGRKHGFAMLDSGGNWVTNALVAADESTWILQFAIRKETAEDLTGDGCELAISNSSGEQFAVVQVNSGDSDGNFKMELRRGATVLATAGPYQWGANPQAWHAFQLKVLIHASAGTYDLKHWDYFNNASTDATGTGANTSNQGSGGGDRFTFGTGSAGVNHRIDDVVAMDGTGGVDDDLTTDPFVVHGALPNAEGNQNDWLPSTGSDNSALVDDAKESPGGTDKVTTESVNDVDLYAMTAFGLIAPTSTPTIAAVQVNIEGAMQNSGSRTIRARVRNGVTEANGSTDLGFSSTAKVTLAEIFSVNPVTSVAWTKANLDADEFGMEMTA
jgi:hypothetical protein